MQPKSIMLTAYTVCAILSLLAIFSIVRNCHSNPFSGNTKYSVCRVLDTMKDWQPERWICTYPMPKEVLDYELGEHMLDTSQYIQCVKTGMLPWSCSTLNDGTTLNNPTKVFYKTKYFHSLYKFPLVSGSIEK